jgi:hypothetical protein
MGSILVPDQLVMDGLAPLHRRIAEERRHPTLPARRVSFGELLSQVMVGQAPMSVGTLRRVFPA